MKFMAKIKCPIWQLLATTHAHCHKCGRLALTISYSAPHQSRKSKQSRQVIYSSGFCEFDFYTYSVFRLYSIIFCGLVLFCRFFFSIRLVLLGVRAVAQHYQNCYICTLSNAIPGQPYVCHICYHICFSNQSLCIYTQAHPTGN